jgi:hypothetical protein
LAGLTATALNGCDTSTEPAEAFSVELRVVDSGRARGVLPHVSPSQPVVVSLELANYGRAAVVYEVPCPIFRVTDEHEVEVGPPAASCADVFTGRYALWPGESVTFSSRWAGEGFDGALLPIGAYGFGAQARRTDRSYSIDTGIGWACLVPDGYTPRPGPPTSCPRPSPTDPGTTTFDPSGRMLRPLGGRSPDPWLETH